MRSRMLPAALAGSLLIAGAVLAPPAVARAEADTSAPSFRLLPGACGHPTPCRTERLEVFGTLAAGDDLARLTVTLDGVVVDDHVYDAGDGSGFQSYGYFTPAHADYVAAVDYAYSVPVPSGGRHDVVVEASDPAGNTATTQAVVLGAEAPGRPGRLRARVHGRSVSLRIGAARPHGGWVTHYLVRRDGGPVRRAWVFVPGPAPRIDFHRLRPGRHRFSVRAVNSAGTGRARHLVVRVPRRG